MSQLNLVKDQLLSQGTNHFVIVSSTGEVVSFCGEFENREKQQLAGTIIQQCTALLEPEEKLKRVTMAVDDAVYVATTIVDGQNRYGVVIKRSAESTVA